VLDKREDTPLGGHSGTSEEKDLGETKIDGVDGDGDDFAREHGFKKLDPFNETKFNNKKNLILLLI